MVSVPLLQRLRVLVGANRGLRQPARMATGSAGQKVEQHLVLAQHTLLPVLDQWIENSMPRKKLAWVFLDP
jgi:hypothetical protein